MRRLLPIAGLVLASPFSAQSFWTVDDDGPADFIDIQAAVDAAADGDVILVRPGMYGRIVIDGKGVTLQSEVKGGASIFVPLVSLPNIVIENLAPSQSVSVRGFTTFAIGGQEQETVIVEDCAGSVLFEDCDIDGVGEPVVLRDCASATFVNCELVAPGTFANYSAFSFFGFAPYAGLVATDSNVFLYDCDIRGSSGGPSFVSFFAMVPPGPAAAGVVMRGSTLLASGCTMIGGSGGSGVVDCYAGEDGEAGIELRGGPVDPSSTAYLLDCAIAGGTGGTGTCGMGDGADAPARIISTPSQAFDLPGVARSMRLNGPVQGGTPLTFALSGEPNDVTMLHFSHAASNGILLPQFGLAFHLQLPFEVLPLGIVPASGTLNLSVPLPPLPGLEGILTVAQCLFIGSTAYFDGGPSTLLVLGGAL